MFRSLLMLVISLVPLCHFQYVGASDDMSSTGYKVDLTPIEIFPSARPTSPLRWLLETITNFLLIAIVVFAGIAGVVAGYIYMFAGISSDGSKRAINVIRYNVIALFVAFFSYSIILFVSWLISV